MAFPDNCDSIDTFCLAQTERLDAIIEALHWVLYGIAFAAGMLATLYLLDKLGKALFE